MSTEQPAANRHRTRTFAAARAMALLAALTALGHAQPGSPVLSVTPSDVRAQAMTRAQIQAFLDQGGMLLIVSDSPAQAGLVAQQYANRGFRKVGYYEGAQADLLNITPASVCGSRTRTCN